MEKKLLFIIFLLALLLRVYKVGTFPIGFHIDEAKVAWNAYSILKTGKDDLGKSFSLYYNTFGDYRPTGIFYLTIPSIALFGVSEFAVRFPSAFFGALSVFPLYLFARELMKSNKQKVKYSITGMTASFLLAVSPWHIETGRATSEVVVSAFFVILSLYLLIRSIRNKSYVILFFSLVSLLISTLLYHSIRFLAPIYIFITLLYLKESLKNPVAKRIGIAAFAFSLILTILFGLIPGGRGRFSQVSIVNDVDTKYELSYMTEEENGPLKSPLLKLFHNAPSVYARRILNEYSNYFSGGFLVGFSARPYRYITPGMGLLTLADAILFVLGLISIFKYKKGSLPLALLLVSPIPAALTTDDSPNLHRALFMILFIVIIEAYGFILILKNKVYRKTILGIIAVLWISNFIFFLHMYFVHSKIHRPLNLNVNMDASSFRNIGAKELAYKLDKLIGTYEKIVVTNFPDDPYPWYAFFTGHDPEEFNRYAEKRILGPWTYQNILFSQSKCPSDEYFKNFTEENILVVDSGICPDAARINDGFPMKIVDKIVRPDLSDVYVLLDRK